MIAEHNRRRLRTTARVLGETCELAEQRGLGSRYVELAANYARSLDGWCVGERSSKDLVSAVLLVSRALAAHGSAEARRRRQGSQDVVGVADVVDAALLRAAYWLNDVRVGFARYRIGRNAEQSTSPFADSGTVSKIIDARAAILGEPREHAVGHVVARGRAIDQSLAGSASVDRT